LLFSKDFIEKVRMVIAKLEGKLRPPTSANDGKSIIRNIIVVEGEQQLIP